MSLTHVHRTTSAAAATPTQPRPAQPAPGPPAGPAFGLVQELHRGSPPAAPGSVAAQILARQDKLHRAFTCAFMGRSEYDTVLPAALARLRSAGPLSVAGHRMTLGGTVREVFVIAPAACLPERAAALARWVQGPARRGEHDRQVRQAAAGAASAPVAWWALHADVAWALDRTVADELAAALSAARHLAG